MATVPPSPSVLWLYMGEAILIKYLSMVQDGEKAWNDT